jgi:hypothetical protein
VGLHFVTDTLIVRDLIGKQKNADVASSLAKTSFECGDGGR